jgi:glyoxylase-like metal-dependent hydrolase (beta-lactamase superfamily II)
MTNRIRRFNSRAALLLLAAISGGLLSAQVGLAQQGEAVRSITHLAGDVYRFRNDGHYSVFMVTPEGVIATDPISPEAAAWLNTEIKSRFNQEVKYVLYSHDHWDHVSGAAAFAGATIIAHANAVPHIEASDRPIELPDITFTSELVLKLGSKTVHLYFLGEGHSDNLVYMVFPDEKILFGVDSIAVNRLPFGDMAGTNIDGVIGSIAALERMEIDIVAPGHGELGTLADLAAHRIYLESLKDQVTEALRDGASDQEILAMIKMPQYSHWGSYEAWQQQNVQGMIRYVKNNYRF